MTPSRVPRGLRVLLLAGPPAAAIVLLIASAIWLWSQGQPAVPRRCPVCNMQGLPDRSLRLGGATYYFCDMPRVDHREDFRKDPRPYLRKLAVRGRESGAASHRDPVCLMTVGESLAAEHSGAKRYFCSPKCRELFLGDPQSYLTETCPVCRVKDDKRTPVDRDHAPMAAHLGQVFFFCGDAHRGAFESDPGTYFTHRMWGIPPSMFYVGGAGVLLITFAGLGWAGLRRSPRGPPPDEGKNPWRLDLLGSGRWKRFATHRVTEAVIKSLSVSVFILIIVAGLFGSQDSAENIAPILTWTLWWAGLTALIVFGGHAWCAVCPWDALSGWVQKLPFFGPRPFTLGLPWPRPLRNLSLAIVGLAFLSWFELGFHVSLDPRITAYCALGILAMAAISGVLFDRKSFCRYGCLVGRTIGMYSLFGGLEVRHREKDVCVTKCKTKDCYTGNEKGQGCPTFEFPQVMEHNTYCILCGECLRTCPHDNIGVFLRPPAADLVKPLEAKSSESVLALLILGITAFHGLAMTPPGRAVAEWFATKAGTTALGGYSLSMAASLAGPIGVFAALAWASARLAGGGVRRVGEVFIHYAYSLLPVALFYHLAHNAQHVLTEGPKVLTLISDPLGWGWDLFGTAGMRYPPLLSLGTIWYVQVALIAIGHLYSLWAADAIGRNLYDDPKRAFRSQIPAAGALVLFSVFSLWLLMQPMDMRTSAM